MPDTKLNEIHRAIGRVEGTLTGVHNKLDKINGTLDKHDTRINKVESDVDQAKGKATLLGGVAGFVVIAGEYLIKKFLGK